MEKSRAFPGAWSDIESLSSGSHSLHHASTSPGTRSLPSPVTPPDTIPCTTPVSPKDPSSPMSSSKALDGWERWTPTELKDYVLGTFPDDELSVEELAMFISSHKVHSQLIVCHIDEIDVICETEKEREMLRAITRSLLRVIKPHVRAHTSRPGLGAIFPDISNVVSATRVPNQRPESSGQGEDIANVDDMFFSFDDSDEDNDYERPGSQMGVIPSDPSDHFSSPIQPHPMHCFQNAATPHNLTSYHSSDGEELQNTHEIGNSHSSLSFDEVDKASLGPMSTASSRLSEQFEAISSSDPTRSPEFADSGIVDGSVPTTRALNAPSVGHKSSSNQSNMDSTLDVEPDDPIPHSPPQKSRPTSRSSLSHPSRRGSKTSLRDSYSNRSGLNSLNSSDVELHSHVAIVDLQPVDSPSTLDSFERSPTLNAHDLTDAHQEDSHTSFQDGQPDIWSHSPSSRLQCTPKATFDMLSPLTLDIHLSSLTEDMSPFLTALALGSLSTVTDLSTSTVSSTSPITPKHHVVIPVHHSQHLSERLCTGRTLWPTERPYRSVSYGALVPPRMPQKCTEGDGPRIHHNADARNDNARKHSKKGKAKQGRAKRIKHTALDRDRSRSRLPLLPRNELHHMDRDGESSTLRDWQPFYAALVSAKAYELPVVQAPRSFTPDLLDTDGIPRHTLVVL